MTSEANFEPVTVGNVVEIGRRLREHGGYLLTVCRAVNWEFTITLYERPWLSFNSGPWINTRHQAGNATNPLEDRQYRFGKRREKTGLEQLFTSLDREHHRLMIAAEWGGSKQMNFGNVQYMYVSEKKSLSAAFKYFLEHPISSIDPPVTSNDIEAMIAYILEDLDTKAVVSEIIAAGVEADAHCGC